MVDLWVYYSNADEVELFVNEKSQGVKKKENDELHVVWRVPFEAGTIKVISRKAGEVVLEKEDQPHDEFKEEDMINAFNELFDVRES